MKKWFLFIINLYFILPFALNVVLGLKLDEVKALFKDASKLWALTFKSSKIESLPDVAVAKSKQRAIAEILFIFNIN
jgi:hypothetical protein